MPRTLLKSTKIITVDRATKLPSTYGSNRDPPKLILDIPEGGTDRNPTMKEDCAQERRRFALGTPGALPRKAFTLYDPFLQQVGSFDPPSSLTSRSQRTRIMTMTKTGATSAH